tara:strand:- start:544 stop:963 length:420 start_codon:yes stop_codon:yes gene_type:complete
MNEQVLKQLIASADKAINEEDFDKVLDFYSDDATLVVMPGKNVTGKEQIRKAFVAIAEHFNHSLEVSQGEMMVVEGGDTALVIAKTKVRANKKTDSPFVADRKATYIFRKYPDGNWLCVVDNSYGTDLLSDMKNLHGTD